MSDERDTKGTPITAADLPTTKVTVQLCGDKRDGATCNRHAGHGGAHCSIPELMDIHPEAFAQVTAEMAGPPITGADRSRATEALGELGQVRSAVESVARAIATERARLVHLADHKHDPTVFEPCKDCEEWERIKSEVFAIPGKGGR